MSRKLFYLLAVTASFSGFNLYADQNCDSCEEERALREEIEEVVQEAEKAGVSREEVLELINEELGLDEKAE
jgi:hypothetical protein